MSTAIFEGGGVKGIGLVGALHRLERNGLKFTRVVGTSAGAIVAALYAAGYTSSDMFTILWGADFARILTPAWPGWLSAWKRFGLHRSDGLYAWIYKLLKAKGVEKFSDLGACDLMVVAFDVTNRCLLTFDRESHPRLAVAQAVRMSSLLPFFFQAYRFGEDLVVDGGVLSNFPIWATEEADTIGLRLVDDERIEPPHPPGNLITFAQALFLALGEAHDKRIMERSEVPIVRIPTHGISSRRFGLQRSEKRKLYVGGSQAARNFLKSYRAPSPAPPSSRVFAESAAVTLACLHLQENTDVDQLCIWGHSLSWAQEIRRTLSEVGHPALNVSIFFPSDSALECLQDKNAESNRHKRLGNIANWRLLFDEGKIGSLTLIESPMIPNELGLMLDTTLLCFGSYGYKVEGGGLGLFSQDRNDRLFLVFRAGEPEGDLMIKFLGRQLLCRRHDAVRVEILGAQEGKRGEAAP